MYSIECRRLVKKYDDFTAVAGVDFAVDKGTICGFLGPNGAGKSTVIKMLSCRTTPDEGIALVSNLDVATDRRAVLSVIGVAPQEHSFYAELSVMENLLYFGSLYNVPSGELNQRCSEVLKLLELYEKRDSRARALSGGMKTRLNIACSLVHKPAVVILDEPSVGLDPVSRRALWRTIKNLKSLGITVLLTTHYMDEVEELCDTIFIMHKGKIVARGTPDDLKKGIGEEVVTIKSSPGDHQRLRPLIEKLKGVVSLKIARDRFTITTTGKDVGSILAAFKEAGEEVVLVSVGEPSLEEVFIHITGEEWH